MFPLIRSIKLLRCASLCIIAACGSKAAAPTVHPKSPTPSAEVQVEATEQPSDAPPPDPFALPEDSPVDSQQLLEDMRHNCCTEMPAQEIEQHRQRP